MAHYMIFILSLLCTTSLAASQHITAKRNQHTPDSAQNGVIRLDYTTDNPAKITSHFSPTVKNTFAQALYLLKGGTLRNVYDPIYSHEYGAEISSVQCLGQTCFYGTASYVRHVSKGRQYNGMFRPASPLITIADTIRGTQEGETYHLSGAVAQQISSHWITGASIDYTAGNNAKDTDPRNKNNINDLKIIPGINYITGRVQLGVSFSWLRSREAISYASFGGESKDGVTYYPLWFYTTESFTSGINANRNYHRNSYAPAFQFQYQDKKWYVLFQPEYTWGDEKIWINPSSRQSGGETANRKLHLKNKTEYASLHFVHLLAPAFTHTKYSGYNLFQQLSKDNRIYETTLRIKRSQVTSATAEINYTLRPGGTPAWKTMVMATYGHRETSLRIYPANFIQTLSHISLSAGYTRQFCFSKNFFDCGMRVNYSKGWGQQPDFSKLGENTIFHLNGHLLAKEFNYLTANTAGTFLHLRYAYQLRYGTRLYTEINYNFRHTLATSPVEGGHYALGFNTGITF